MAEKAPNRVPEHMHTITPHFWFNGNCREAIDFYVKALGAEVQGEIIASPDGDGVWHAMLKVGSSHFMMADSMPGSWEQGPAENSTMGIWLYVEDCDAVFNKAMEAGCELLMPMMDMFWGDRMGKLKDPFGHCWAIASHAWIYTPEEMQQKQAEMMENTGG